MGPSSVGADEDDDGSGQVDDVELVRRLSRPATGAHEVRRVRPKLTVRPGRSPHPKGTRRSSKGFRAPRQATFAHAAAAANAVDSLVTNSVGGVDVPACEAALEELRAACEGLAGAFATAPPATDTARETPPVQAALDASAAEIG
ncbi:unnamed protein product [Prorocentrum cordatum]|uniref:Uncharacterized protein n=1 Tax=Prorocentrum cordatum TaxID=2364126 RepID=A0ABN9UAW7_9DINO|nr:unnamed protein product [Polarella glacialis]